MDMVLFDILDFIDSLHKFDRLFFLYLRIPIFCGGCDEQKTFGKIQVNTEFKLRINMEIKLFEEKDIQDATMLAKNVWGVELQNEREDFVLLVNEHLVRYNYLNKDYSFKIVENGVMQGFIFATFKDDTNDSNDWILSKIQDLSETEKNIVRELMNYYKNNSNRIFKLLQNRDVFLTFFVSGKKGCGKLLIKELIKKSTENGFSNMYLWTDTSCDYQYYKHNNFTLVTQFRSQDLTDMGEEFQTFIYKKEI